MTTTKFTDRRVRNLRPKASRYEIWEGNGLGLRIAPTGRKSWVYVYHFRGKPRRLTLGSYPQMSVAQAHAAYGEALTALEQGIDPGEKIVSARQALRVAPTVRELAEVYIEKWAKPRKGSWKEDQRMLDKDVLPAWGKLKAADVTRRDVMNLLDKIVARGAPITANRTLEVIRRMYNFAIEQDILSATPCIRVRAPAPEQRRDRVLREDEIRTFLAKLEDSKMSESAKLALKLQLYTAQRRGEVVAARWSEIDFTAKIWTIPAEKSKNRLSHRVPLSEEALQILEEAYKLSSGSDWVFPSPRGDNSITDRSVSRAVLRNREHFGIADLTPHDLRRTAASHMTSLGIPRLVVSKILNHADSSVTAVYDRHSYDMEKKNALDSWAAFLCKVGRVGDTPQKK